MTDGDDTRFMGELRAAVTQKPRMTANLLLGSIIVFVIFVVIWAANAPLDEVTRGMGRVIRSSQLKVIQNLEGGLVSSIAVAEGEVVEVGQVLLTIDDTQARSRVSEDKVKLTAMEVLISRLKAEIAGRPPEFSEALQVRAGDYIANEMALYQARRSELKQAINVLKKQKEQKHQELLELSSRISGLEESYKLGKQQLDMLEKVVKRGASPRMELVKLQREVVGLKNELSSSRNSIPRVKASLEEVDEQISERIAAFKSTALKELNEAITNHKALEQNMLASEDRLSRTAVVSPVRGIVKQLLINTIGGVVQPGMDLVEIVPEDESMLVEARVRPSEIAFLHIGQKAKVKLTAYDYAVYGTLDAELEHVSADTITDENGESFFEIRVRTEKKFMGDGEEVMPIMPGMVAEVDVLTGKKTVLEYLMKPIVRARQRAFSER